MYLAANGIIMGKAALDELQDGGNSVNPTNQYTDGLITTMLNAYNQTRIAGGRLHAASRLPAPARFLVDSAVAQGIYGKCQVEASDGHDSSITLCCYSCL